MILLSDVDYQISQLLEKRKEIPEAIEQIEAELGQIKSDLEKERANLTELSHQKSQKEIELDELKDWIEKRKEHLKEISTNKEYHATVKEIDQATKKINQLETEVLNLLEQVEEKQKEIGEFEEQVKKDTGLIQQEKEEKQNTLDSINREVEEKLTQRKKAEAELEPSELEKYNALKQNIQPVLSKIDRGSCSECFKRIPPQVHNQVLRLETIIHCPHCKRILVSEEIEAS